MYALDDLSTVKEKLLTLAVEKGLDLHDTFTPDIYETIKEIMKTRGISTAGLPDFDIIVRKAREPAKNMAVANIERPLLLQNGGGGLLWAGGVTIAAAIGAIACFVLRRPVAEVEDEAPPVPVPVSVERVRRVTGIYYSADDLELISELNFPPGTMPIISELAEALPHLPSLGELRLRGNFIGVEGIRILAVALPFCPIISHLDLGGTGLGVEGCRELALILPRLRHLSILRLDDNAIGVEGMRHLATALPSLRQLTRLQLSRNSIGDAGIHALVAVLPGLLQLVNLDLDENSIDVAGARDLASILPRFAGFRSLSLNRNGFGNEGIAALSVSLRSCLGLRILSLSGCGIGDEGAEALAATLPSLQLLEVLNLDNNEIGDGGAIALAGTLRSCPLLATLNLDFNQIGPAGKRALNTAGVNTATWEVGRPPAAFPGAEAAPSPPRRRAAGRAGGAGGGGGGGSRARAVDKDAVLDTADEKLLGLGHGYTLEDLKTSYKKSALKYHPDKPTGNEEIFKEVLAAYTRLLKRKFGIDKNTLGGYRGRKTVYRKRYTKRRTIRKRNNKKD